MPRFALTLVVAGSLVSTALVLGDPKPSYQPPAPAKDPENLGVNIQRTMKLLATSTPEHRNRVRILFYGQSITEQDWWKRVAADLRRRFPYADLEIENRAIGGFAAQLLIRPAEHDLYPYYPDLLIFHVYGANQEYEQIIKNTRSRTTAEVLMQKDHVTKWPPQLIDKEKDKGMWWDDLMNHKFLPEIAQKYGCGLVNIRGAWLDYLQANHLEPRDLLVDGAHLNDRGNYLMAELVKRYLVYRPELTDKLGSDMVRTLEVGKDVLWNDGKLRLNFEGNRVEALFAPSAKESSNSAKVLIDGHLPSELTGVYRVTRPAPGPWSPLTVSRIDHDKPLVEEEWTAKIMEANSDSTKWRFRVRGSRTGEDGAGESSKAFVSNSGRVKIDPGAWFRNGTKIPVGYVIRWKVKPMFTDTLQPPATKDPSRENAVLLAQGFPNTRHTLEITCQPGQTMPIQFLRVYRPPVR